MCTHSSQYYDCAFGSVLSATWRFRLNKLKVRLDILSNVPTKKDIKHEYNKVQLESPKSFAEMRSNPKQSADSKLLIYIWGVAGLVKMALYVLITREE